MFGIEWVNTVDNSGFVKTMNEVQDSVRHTAKVLQSVGDDFNIDGVINQYISLTKVIQHNESVISSSRELIKQWQQESVEALDEGDFERLNNKQLDITDELDKIEDLSKETERAKEALRELFGVWEGLRGKEPVTLFKSQEDYDHVQELKVKIGDLQNKIAELGDTGDEGELLELKGNLSSLKDELYACEQAAVQNAAGLGKSGSMVAEASTHYYELTYKVREQFGVVGELMARLRVAKGELDNAMRSGDAQSIMDARAKYDALSYSLSEARKTLVSLQGEQEEFGKKMLKVADDTSSAGSEIIGVFKNIAALAGISFSLGAAKDFVNQVVQMRSYFQDIESSMKVFLGSEKAGADFTKKLKDYAYYNMFEFSDLAKASQQMIAYGHDIDTIIPRIDQLSNVAVGTHGSLMELVNSYNKAKSTGVLDGRDIQSWAVKGVMIKDVLKEMGDEVVGTSVTFEQLNKVLDKVTGEGGMFHELQLSMMENISAEIGQFHDNFDSMLNEIGEKYQGVITGVIKTGSALVDNYKQIGKLLMDAVAAYGAYRVALVVSTAAQKAHVFWQHAAAVAARVNAAAKTGEVTSVTTSTVAWSLATKELRANTAAMLKNTAAWLTNPYVLVGAAVGALAFGIYKLATAEDAETAARRRANEEMDEFKKRLDEQKDRVNSYIQTVQDPNATKFEKAVAWDSLKKEMPTLTERYTEAELAAKEFASAQKEVNEEMEKAKFGKLEEEMQKLGKLRNELLGNDYAFNGLSDETKTFLRTEYGVTPDMGNKVPYRVQKEFEERFNVIREEYETMMKFYDDLEEKNKPIEIQVKEAEANANEKQRILDFYDEAMTLAKGVESATNNQDYTEAVKNFDNFIAELDTEINNLRKKIENDPLNPKFQIELEEKERMREELLGMKANWVGIFASPIPVTFQMKFEQAKAAAQEELGKAPEGYHWQKTMLNDKGWTLVQDTPEKTFTQSYKETKKRHEERSKELQTIQNNAESGKTTWVTGTGDSIKIVTKGSAGAREAVKKDFDDIKRNADNASKAFKEMGGDYNGKKADKAAREAAKQAKEDANRREKVAELERRQDEEREKQSIETRHAIEEARIAGISDDNLREREEKEHQHKLALEQIDREEEEMKKKLFEYNKSVWEANNKDKKTKFTDTQQYKEGWKNLELSEEQYAELEAKRNKEYAKHTRETLERNREDIQSMRDYLKEYGTYEQRKLAITEEYEDKIKKARNEGERMTLRNEEQRELAEMDAQRMAMNIDWSQSFSGVGNVLRDLATETLKEVEDYMQTDQFKNLTPEGKKAYLDLSDRLRQEGAGEQVSPFNFKIWGTISKNVEDYQKSVLKLKAANEKHRDATERLRIAQEALKNATEDEKDVWLGVVDEARSDVDVTATDVTSAEEEVDESRRTLRDNTNKASEGLERFADTLSEVSSGSLYGFANGITKAVTGASKGLAELGKVGGVVAAVLQILDAMGDKPAEFIEQTLDKLDKSIEALLADLPNIVSAAVSGVGNVVSDVVGGVGKLFGADIDFGDVFGGGTKHMEEAVKKWGWLLDTWKDNLDYERKLMEDAYGERALEIQQKTEDDVRKTQNAAREMYEAWAKDGGGLFRHSHGYKANEAANWDYLRDYDEEMYNMVGKDITNLFNLTAEQLEELRHHDSQFWQSLDENARQYLNMIIESEEALEEFHKEANAQLTGTSFDSVVSDFANALSNMESDSTDFASHFEDYMRHAVMNSLMVSKYKGQLEEWYKRFAELTGSGNELTAAEQESLRKDYEAIYSEAIRERDALRDTMGWGNDYDKEGSSGRFQTMSQETGDELSGRFTALQISGESIRAQVTMIMEQMTLMGAIHTSSNLYLQDMRNMLITSNSYLDDIAKYSKKIYNDFTIKIDSLVTNTNRI